MRKYCAFILLILLAAVPAAGLEVDIDELKKAGRIELINYAANCPGTGIDLYGYIVNNNCNRPVHTEPA